MSTDQDTTPDDFRLATQVRLPAEGISPNAVRRRRFYAAHTERSKASTQAWRDANPDAVRAAKRRNYEKHRDAKVAKQKAYYEANKEVINAKAKIARDADPEKQSATHRRYLEKNREKVRVSRKANQLRRSLGQKYGLTPAEFSTMQEAQDGRCPICKTTFNPALASFRPCVDHDHATGKVRGILCRLCNTGMGQFRDDPEFLLAAARYLEADKEGAIA